MNKETPKRAPLSSAYRNSAAVLPWMLCAASLIAAEPAQAGGALPTNGQYVAGQGSIASAAGTVTVNQSSSHGIINWQNFSIGQGNSVLFNNGSGATLNRVTGNQISQIDGSLKATGSVYLINPQGIVIGPSGQVIANGSFVASTRDVDNNAFMSGQAFSASGTSNGSIINQGVITSNNGDAILVGSSVTNTGSILAPHGTVGLAAGNEITLQPAGGDSRIAISGGTGSVTNSGNLKAAQAELNAAGGNVYALVENNGGQISATGTQTVGGHVWLTAGGTGTVTIAGVINAKNANGSGGDVTVRGHNIVLPGSINASASTANGAGGNVSVVATNNTSVTGAIHAGGGTNGQGGSIETSGHSLSFGGANVDAGKGGNWLLDPYDLTVDSTAATTIDASLGAGTSVTLQTTSTGASGPGNQNASGTGNINIDAPMSWSSSATLTLKAYQSLNIDAPITVSGRNASVVLATNDGGTGGSLSFGLTSTGFEGDLQFTAGDGSGQTLSINGTPYTLLYTLTDVENINGNLSGTYALAKTLNAASVSWTPIAENFGTSFAGIFEGLGNTIDNLSVSKSTAGLFGTTGGTVRDIGIVGGTIHGNFGTGALGGYNNGTVVNSFATATVAGGGYGTGGLFGYNGGLITNSYATGSVSAGGQGVGGLVGWQTGGEILQSYATGTVRGSNLYVGGLVGIVQGSTVSQSFATGAVFSTGGYVGGLVGNNLGNIVQSYSTGLVVGGSHVGGLTGSGGASSSFWDIGTSGQASSAGGTGLTTAALQSALPSGFSPSAWSTGTGLYPYLTSLFPNGLSAVSGIAYSDAGTTPLASTASGTVAVSVLVNGNSFASANTGANGYYYAFGQPVAAGSTALAYVNANATTGAKNAVAISDSLSATGVSGLNLYGNTLNEVTAATLYSKLPNVTAAAGGNANALAALAGTTLTDITATGASFTFDVPATISSNTELQTTGSAPIIVAQALTVAGASALTLDTANNIAFDADVTVTGAGALSILAAEYGFLPGDNVSFTGGEGSGASLTINGAAYTLLFSMGDVQNINNALGGNYALARSLNAATDSTTPTSWAPIGTDGVGDTLGSGFTGNFEGLGNAISNLTVNVAANQYVGLFGYVGGGTIRDIGLIGGSVTGGGNFTGALVGYANGEMIENSYAESTVSGENSGFVGVGGLVGNLVGGEINDSYATGAVFVGAATSSADVGGLVGRSSGTVDQSYATGNVTNLTGTGEAGGLVGLNTSIVENTFATGAVEGHQAAGLVAYNFEGAQVNNSFATGRLSTIPGESGNPNGGVVGANLGGSVNNSYWDTQTTGTTVDVGGEAGSSNAVGMTTAQLQGALPAAFDPTIWSTGAGLYPYLTSLFPNGIAAVSGTVYSKPGGASLVTGINGVTVSVLANGNNFGSVTIGADDYYYTFGQPLVSGSSVLAFTNANVVTGATNSVAFASSVAASGQSGADLYANTLTDITPATLYSHLPNSVTAADAAAGGNAGALAAIAATTSERLIATGASFTFDQPLTVSSNLLVQTTAANAPITVAQPITLAGANALTLNATANIAFNANVTVTGGGALSFSMGGGDDYSLTPGTTITFTGGEGSGASLTIDGNPYTLLYSMSDVENINNGLNGRYALAQSLDASSIPVWTRVGTGGDSFTGTFAGFNHTISNLSYISSSVEYVGLFGESFGTIRDVGMIGGTLYGNYYVGALVGYNGGTIQNSYSTATVLGGNLVGDLAGYNTGMIRNSYATGFVAAGGYDIGGLVGRNNGTILDSFATGSVGGYRVGGLVGVNNGTITQSYATGPVSGTNVGGLVAHNTGSISQSYATGALSGSGVMGGLVGANSNAISDSYWDVGTSGLSVGIGTDSNHQSGNVTGLTTAQMMNGANFAGWTFGGLGSGASWVLVDSDGTINNASGAAGGTTPMFLSEYSTNIVNAHQLQLMALDPTANYTLLANVNASGTAGGDVWGAQGFVPIGGNNAAAFTGSFNGQNYTISGLTINAPTLSDVGLFGVNNGAISNVTLTGGTVAGSGFVGGVVGWNTGTLTNDAAGVAVTETGFGNAGGLAGENSGTISGSNASGAVTATFAQAAEGDIVGGLVGQNDGGTIANSSATGAVSGTTVLAGGLVGDNVNPTSSISGSTATGSVTASGSATYAGTPVAYNQLDGLNAQLNAGYAGGLVGENGGDVNTSAASGVVSGVTGTGGFVGRNVAGGTIENSTVTASGTVSGTNQVGGFAGWNDGTITGSNAWTVSVSGTGYGAGGFVGYNTSTGDIEESGTSGNNLAGTLSSLGTIRSSTGGAGGFAGSNVGSLSNDTAAQFAVGSSTSSTDVGGFVGQTLAGSTITTGAVTDTSVTGGTYVGGFVGGNAGSISGSSASTATSSGVYAVSGTSYVGGFAGDNIAGASISNSSSSNTGSTAVFGTGNRIGGFVGWNAGTLTSDQSSDAVSGAAQVGGFVGWNDGAIDNATALQVAATGTGYGAGGFVGYNTATGTIEGSTASGNNMQGTLATFGNVNATGGGSGGFVGLNSGSLASDTATQIGVGSSAVTTVGGFVGQNAAGGAITNSLVTDSTAMGSSFVGAFTGMNYGWVGNSSAALITMPGSYAVSGASYVGGFVGGNEASGVVANSSVTGAGSVDGTGNRVGGFAGWNAGNLTGGDTTSVAVLGAQQVGGLVGWNDGAITDASASGAATGMSAVGGLVGFNTATARISQSFATGTVSGTGNVGGLVGDNLGGITNAYATGSVSAPLAFNVGGLVGLNSGTISDVYADGTVIGEGHVGALVGSNASGSSVTHAYIDAAVTGALPAAGANAGTLQVVTLGGPGEPSLTLQATYVGFDFTNVWTIAPGDMPTLLHAP